MRPLSTRATGLARARDRALADARAAADAGDIAAHARAADRTDAAEEALAGLLPDAAGPSVAARGLLNGAAILAGGRAGVRDCGRGDALPAVASFW